MFPKRKEYVEVVSRTDRTGEIVPLSVTMRDGRRYDIERVLDHRRVSYSTASGERGERWRVRIGHKVTYVWRETVQPGDAGRWYVEVLASYVPGSPFVEDPATNAARAAGRR